jgi:hypothetical protein
VVTLRRAVLIGLALLGSHATGGELVAPVADDYLQEIAAFRDYRNYRFGDRVLSPLPEADRLAFTGLDYFDVAPSLVVPATLVPAADRSTFAMPTFNGRTMPFSHYGTLTARIDGRPIRLKAFRREEADQGYFLLIPFRDPTNGDETYSGGRYIEIDLPLPEPLVLDFNRAVNPMCAYDSRFACPIPPPENRLPMPIRAGEKRYH